MTENEKSEFSKRLAKQFEAQGIEIVENPEDILSSVDTPSADEGAIISPGMLPMNLKRRVEAYKQPVAPKGFHYDENGILMMDEPEEEKTEE